MALFYVTGLSGTGKSAVRGELQCFQAVARYGEQELGVHQHPDVSLDCIAMGRSMPAWETGDYDTIRATLARSVERLARSGADFFAAAHLPGGLAAADAGLDRSARPRRGEHRRRRPPAGLAGRPPDGLSG
jgi:hypothetical protein